MVLTLSQMMLTGILFLTIFSSFGLGKANKQTQPALCQPWRVPVEVDTPDHKYQPYYVEMHRCQGQCHYSSPHHCECVPDKKQDVKVNIAGAVNGLQVKIVQNHTSCTTRCRASYKKQCHDGKYVWDQGSCMCHCPSPPSRTTCQINQRWDSGKCQCVCQNHSPTCPKGMLWNKSICECQCSVEAFTRCSKIKKATNLVTCKCETEPPLAGQVGSAKMSGSETKLVASLVVIGLLLGTLFIIDLVLLGSKKGFMYGLVTKCRENKGSREFTNEDADTGSINMDNDNTSSFAEYKLNGNCNHKNTFLTPDSGTCV